MVTNRKLAMAHYYRTVKGYSVRDIAYLIFSVSPRTINRWLKKYLKQHPESLPVLTPFQTDVKDCYESGLTPKEIALYLKRPLKSVYKITKKLGLIKKKPKTIRYEPHMDNKVKQRF